MDVSPQLLREVEFREQWRGYNPDEVDDFLERLAVALGQLQEQLREAVERASRAERRVLEGSSDEDGIKRTLVLAQRTADAALKEARQQAAATTAEAEEWAAAVTEEADERAAATGRAADERAASVVSEAQARVATELAPLLAQRDALQADVEALRAWAGEIKARMASELRQQLAWLEGDEADLPAAPEVLEIELPAAEALVTPAEEVAEPSFELPAAASGAPTFAPGGGRADWLDDRDQGEGETPPRREGARQPSPSDDPDATGLYDALADLDEGRPADRGDHGVEGGPLATAAAGDPFLAELRRAVTDDEPLGPRDRVELDAGDHGDLGEGGDEDDPSSSVFRRRKRR